jgi:hypothetical protein
MTAGLFESGGIEMQTAKQPDREHDHEHEADDASEPGPAIAAVAIVATPAAEQQK